MALSERENHSTNDTFWLVESRDAHRLVCVIDVILYPFAQYKLAISWKYCGEHSLIQKQYWYKEQEDYSETQKRQRDSWKNSKVNTRLDKGR